MGQYVAFHGQNEDGGEEQYIGQVEALMGTLSTGPKFNTVSIILMLPKTTWGVAIATRYVRTLRTALNLGKR